MAADENLYSHIVGWAKILLPLSALALLSTLFLFARQTTEPDEIALKEVEEIARDQRVSAPAFSGVTETGAIIGITAKSAQPDAEKPDTVTVDAIRLRMDNTDGSNVEITATQGEIDGRARVAKFTGLARLVTSEGYAMETNGLSASLDTGTIMSDGLLEVQAPFGSLSAGKVTIQAATGTNTEQVLFTDGVRLLYTPQEPQ